MSYSWSDLCVDVHQSLTARTAQAFGMKLWSTLWRKWPSNTKTLRNFRNRLVMLALCLGNFKKTCNMTIGFSWLSFALKDWWRIQAKLFHIFIIIYTYWWYEYIIRIWRYVYVCLLYIKKLHIFLSPPGSFPDKDAQWSCRAGETAAVIGFSKPW